MMKNPSISRYKVQKEIEKITKLRIKTNSELEEVMERRIELSDNYKKLPSYFRSDQASKPIQKVLRKIDDKNEMFKDLLILKYKKYGLKKTGALNTKLSFDPLEKFHDIIPMLQNKLDLELMKR